MTRPSSIVSVPINPGNAATTVPEPSSNIRPTVAGRGREILTSAGSPGPPPDVMMSAVESPETSARRHTRAVDGKARISLERIGALRLKNGLLDRLETRVGCGSCHDLRIEFLNRTERAGGAEFVLGNVEGRHLPRRIGRTGCDGGAQRAADIVLVAGLNPRVRVLGVLQV